MALYLNFFFFIYIFKFLLFLKVEYFGLPGGGFRGTYSLAEQTTVDISEISFRN